MQTCLLKLWNFTYSSPLLAIHDQSGIFFQNNHVSLTLNVYCGRECTSLMIFNRALWNHYISTDSITTHSVMQVHMSIKSVNQPWLAVHVASSISHLVWFLIFKKTWDLLWNNLRLIDIWQWCQFSSHTGISCSVPSIIVLFFILIIMDCVDTELLPCAIICSLFFTLSQHFNSVFQKHMWRLSFGQLFHNSL